MDYAVKVEIPDAGAPPERQAMAEASTLRLAPPAIGVIELSSSESEPDDAAEEGRSASGVVKRSRGSEGRFLEEGVRKKFRSDGGALPVGFLDPLPPVELPATPVPMTETSRPAAGLVVSTKAIKQFWKAGDYEGSPGVKPSPVIAGMDHVRVHPKFLHSNATSHKWALGALAELLDNALDEVCNGATYVNIDTVESKKDGTRMLLVEDDGGGMDPEKMRHCMSLGYSVKSKIANTIGQYGNGFKTSTMRLGADVIVFSRCCGKQGRSDTQSIGMLSYTFLRSTGKEDIVVPLLDYEKNGHGWKRLTVSTLIDWDKNLETIIQWSPFSSEADLLQQFSMGDQGTRIVIYNLWEDDQGKLELDFDANRHDIQLTGVNRDESKIRMAEKYPNSRHFLTYRHSLRSYASILYLRLPRGFRMILRGKEIEHHNIVNDMMMKQEVTYRPQPIVDGVPKDPNMVAVVTMGFVKHAKDHIDVQGFNVYYKNRLIKPFWRIWNPAGSDGRGVIGVLEANFVEPAHDKQDFERTIVLSRLEARLVQMQKVYWSTRCHKIGYAPRRTKKNQSDNESSPELPPPSSRHSGKNASPRSISRMKMSQDNTRHSHIGKSSNTVPKMGKSGLSVVESAKMGGSKSGYADKFERGRGSPPRRSCRKSYSSDESDSDTECQAAEFSKRSSGPVAPPSQNSSQKENAGPSLSSSPCSVYKGSKGSHALNESMTAKKITTRSQSKTSNTARGGDMPGVDCNGNGHAYVESNLSIQQLKDENEALRERLKKTEESMLQELQEERDKNKLLTEQLEVVEKRLEESSKEQEALIDIFSEERIRRDKEEENLRRKIKDASATIEDLREQLSSNGSSFKP